MSQLLFVILGSYVLANMVHAQNQTGFISIDCGLPKNSAYSDATTGLDYVSDAAYIGDGEAHNIAPEYNTSGLQQQLRHLRSFPEGIRNCYTINVTPWTRYLIRATFMYGNYDGQNSIPVFDLHLGPSKWDKVKIASASTVLIREIIATPPRSYLYVCLANTGRGTPFISALELRPFPDTLYQTESSAHPVLLARLDLASATNLSIRFAADVYDRIWTPYNNNEWSQLSTQLTIYPSNDYWPPTVVMSTAATPARSREALNFTIETHDPVSQLYVCMYFAEVEVLQANQLRQFDIFLNEEHWYGPVSPKYLHTTSVTNMTTTSSSEGKYQFSIRKTESSNLPPILNSMEVYGVKELLQYQISNREAAAIMNIRSMYRIKKNWQGDPCAPQAYAWAGLSCIYINNKPSEIVSLNLSSSGLNGNITSDISKLTSLKYLDLSHNSLTGSVPDFLSELQFLQVINLSSNQLTGSIPVKLLEKSQNGFLALSVDGNPNLCTSISCKKKKKIPIIPATVASIATLSILIPASVSTIIWIIRRKKQEGQKVDEEAESNNRKFAYSEIRKMTNSFEKVLGKGGFGTVYHGYLNGTQVAVKMLSSSSTQGYQQFQAEVNLLLRVHHRNLTTLVGYCNDGDKMGLIYEYMANGNLHDHLSDENMNVLNWEGRLRIALEAAQGLEYLHDGCKLGTVHRDVKSTNILLNDKFQAKIADFGLSKSFPNEDATHLSTGVAGTFGYLDPEYYRSRRLTTKSDVYSFGVVLLEIITGRPAVAKTDDRPHISQWVKSMLEMGDIESIVDPRLLVGNLINLDSVCRVVEVAMSCISPTPGGRPSMHQVVVALDECSVLVGLEGKEVESKDPREPIMSVNQISESSLIAR